MDSGRCRCAQRSSIATGSPASVRVWPEAFRDLGRSGIRLDASPAVGEVWRPPGREPMLGGIEHGVLNIILTGTIPMEWDQGRGLSGVTTLYRGFHVCMIALSRAHVNQIPFLSLNTCLHEMSLT